MANFAQSMEYPAEFLRGWPVDGGLELSYPIASGQTLSAGDLVKPVVASGVVYVTKVLGTETDAFPAGAGIVVRGNGDDKSAAAANKAIVLWGDYIVRTQKVDDTVVAGDAVVAGVGTCQTVASTTAIFVAASGVATTPAIPDYAVARLGTVLETGGTAGSATNPFYALIVVR